MAFSQQTVNLPIPFLSQLTSIKTRSALAGNLPARRNFELAFHLTDLPRGLSATCFKIAKGSSSLTAPAVNEDVILEKPCNLPIAFSNSSAESLSGMTSCARGGRISTFVVPRSDLISKRACILPSLSESDLKSIPNMARVIWLLPSAPISCGSVTRRGPIAPVEALRWIIRTRLSTPVSVRLFANLTWSTTEAGLLPSEPIS
mmetsp:Transcript_6957/g.9975  ORF Transcript_6957/g.9975 Transcript_6957/m.9975 type:complete len:203 (+) Transcript_6957:202-810(+)